MFLSEETLCDVKYAPNSTIKINRFNPQKKVEDVFPENLKNMSKALQKLLSKNTDYFIEPLE